MNIWRVHLILSKYLNRGFIKKYIVDIVADSQIHAGHAVLESLLKGEFAQEMMDKTDSGQYYNHPRLKELSVELSVEHQPLTLPDGILRWEEEK